MTFIIIIRFFPMFTIFNYIDTCINDSYNFNDIIHNIIKIKKKNINHN